MKSVIRTICLAALSCLALAAQALPASRFAQTSRLADGKWVKIDITQSGVYEITRQELLQMGFTNPDQVNVYGYGGAMQAESFNNNVPDDLQQIPILRTDDKICFYGAGVVSFEISPTTDAFTRSINAYSRQGHYFLCQDGQASRTPSVEAYNTQATNIRATSLDYFYHEQELASLSFGGKDLLGENILNQTPAFEYTLSNLSEPSFLLSSSVAIRAAKRNATDDVKARFTCTVNTGGDVITAPYRAAQVTVSGCTQFIYYNTATATTTVTLPEILESGTIQYKPELTTTLGNLRDALLDYFIITYNRHNKPSGDGGQFRMAFLSSQFNDAVTMEGTSENTIVWNITTPYQPIQKELAIVEGTPRFSLQTFDTPTQFIAFDPNKTLLKIEGYQQIDNQNLHGMATPDLLIVTNEYFMPEALRLAQHHKELDGIDVAVVDQEKIFNEFSSGTPDPMAIRLFCKMLYDRDTDHSKFKNLLMFGHGSFDNRGIVSKKPNRLITYEATRSNDEDYCYVTDDFFACLNDPRSDITVENEMIQIGVGRITPATIDEARDNVDKIIEYTLNPDYGPWRNNIAAWADHGNNTMHETQAEGILKIITNQLNTGMVDDRAYVAMFPGSVYESFKSEEKRQAVASKDQIKSQLATGQYFVTYIGHANATKFSVTTNLWKSSDVQEYSFPHLPIMTTACCDVARYDSDHRGITEHMFHKRDGGAIALLTTTRQVYANSNDVLNRYWVNAMFSQPDNPKLTLGEVYMKAKQGFGNFRNTNKLNFWLLGDPALKVNIPQQRFTVTHINGRNLTDTVSIAPMQRITIRAEVKTADGQTDTQFNGDAYLTLFDNMQRIFKDDYTSQNVTSKVPIGPYPREELLQIKGEVVNGVFNAEFVVPRYTRSVANPVEISLYAHNPNGNQMVNGWCKQIKLDSYDGYNTIEDTGSPTITAMFLNDERTFAANATVGTDPMLYVYATDDVAFNTQKQTIGKNISLTLDGGKQSYNLVKNYLNATDNGKRLTLAYPMSNLNPGRHSLTITLNDVAGNSVSKTINFTVSGNSDLKLTTTQLGSADKAEINVNTLGLDDDTRITLNITNATGSLVYQKTDATFPFTWNLTNMRGSRVAAGLYKIFIQYDSSTTYGGSNIANFVVVNPIK